MKFSSFLFLLAFAGALTASAQENLPNADSAPTANESIVPIPDCFPCSEDNDPYSEGPADYPPIPFPKPPGLPKCYPICNLDETVAATEEALIVPIPDCFPCSEDNDPYSEGPADYPPIPFPKPPGLPKCYPICNLEETVAATEEALIVPIPDCFPCSEDNDPYSEGPADYPPIPFPKPPGLPKCYPICNLDETVAATEEALIVPIPDCFPCSEDNDPYSEGPADYPPIPFPKPPGLPKCYPICNLEGNSAASLAPVAQVSGLTVPGELAAVVFEVKTATSFVPALSLRRSRHGLV